MLLEALINVKNGRCSRKDVVSDISSLFRRKAIHDKMPMNETYRNVNGINLQLGAMDYAYTSGAQGVKHVSKLFYETVEIYRTHPQEFKDILQNAKIMYSID